VGGAHDVDPSYAGTTHNGPADLCFWHRLSQDHDLRIDGQRDQVPFEPDIEIIFLVEQEAAELQSVAATQICAARVTNPDNIRFQVNCLWSIGRVTMLAQSVRIHHVDHGVDEWRTSQWRLG